MRLVTLQNLHTTPVRLPYTDKVSISYNWISKLISTKECKVKTLVTDSTDKDIT